jgi:homogentisate 1,2-dioxygenase
MIPFCCLRSPATKDGFAIHVYTASTSMDGCCLANADGDFLIVPQQGASWAGKQCWFTKALQPVGAATLL